jgi:K+-transporting ATPase ATPase C chain
MELLRALRLTLVAAVVTGLIYPLVITGISQVFFHDQANGSLIVKNGQLVGSKLIGQNFTDPKYFFGRPSATVNQSDATKSDPYNAQNSAGSNLAPSNKALIDRVAGAVAQIRKENNLPSNSMVPVDLVTTDFSGFDPDITEAGALTQVNHVATARNLDPAKVRALVEKYVQGRNLGIFGEPRVNVLALNMALDNGEAA